MSKITRRQFGKTVAATAAAAYAGFSLPRFAWGEPNPAPLRFPEGFLWGCATAAYQIEGGVKDDGRGPSVWDVFSHTPGKTYHGETGDVADDSYHRYTEDVQLLKNLGVAGYRFSISWPRVFPKGAGQANPKGIDYYERVVDELLKNNITPYVTLFHWDLPQELEAKYGGWQSRDTSKAYADYAAFMAKRLGDRVHHFMTTNEFVCFTDLGYRTGEFAGRRACEPGAPSRHFGARPWGAGDSSQRAKRYASGVGGRLQHVCAGDRNPGTDRSGAQGDAAGECPIPDDGARR